MADAAWQKLPKLSLDAKRMNKRRIVTFDQSDSAHLTFEMMRAKLTRVLRQNNWTTIGFTSPAQRCGKTTVCVNLAISLSHQSDPRTIVCDLDLRQPQIANILDLATPRSIDSFLKGQCAAEDVFRTYGELAVGTCQKPIESPTELLQSESTAQAMKSLRETFKPDVILIDLPPMLVADDVMSFLPNLDAIFLVTSAEETTVEMIERCVKELSEYTNVLGVILNKCRYPGDDNPVHHGYY